MSTALQLELKVWGFSLSSIPTRHLAECIARALNNKRDDFLLRAAAVMREWDVYHEELATRARENQTRIDLLQLPPGHQAGYVSREQWMRAHGLPEEWKLGEPYPPESDLYGTEDYVQSGSGRWVRDPASSVTDERWHRREKKPWELYPNEHNPVRTVRINKEGVRVEWLWYYTVCPEADSPYESCPGVISEFFGPGGLWSKQHPCPDHAFRLVRR